jgi:hypothetical protein
VLFNAGAAFSLLELSVAVLIPSGAMVRAE